MIELINLCKMFNDQRVLDDLNLTIAQGQTTVIIGRSGEGKSVLLKHIVRLMEPDSGQVLIDGVDITRLQSVALERLRMKFGVLFQGAALFDSLTVEENVGFALYEHTQQDQPAIRRRVQECLALVGLSDIEDRYPAELSGGMRKRVGLARALCMNPEIILYDEPTTGVDPVMADVINRLIKELRDKLHVTSIAVTHDMTSAYQIADRIAMLHEGRIIAEGSPEEIRRSPNPIVQQFITGQATGPLTEGLSPGSRKKAWSLL